MAYLNLMSVKYRSSISDSVDSCSDASVGNSSNESICDNLNESDHLAASSPENSIHESQSNKNPESSVQEMNRRATVSEYELVSNGSINDFTRKDTNRSSNESTVSSEFWTKKNNLLVEMSVSDSTNRMRDNVLDPINLIKSTDSSALMKRFVDDEENIEVVFDED